MKRSHSFSWVNLKDLLHKIDKVENFSPLLNIIVERNLLSCFSIHVNVLFFQFVYILLFQKLDEIEKWMPKVKEEVKQSRLPKMKKVN